MYCCIFLRIFYLFNLSTFFFAALRFFFFFVYCTFFSFFVSFFHNDSKWLDSLKILFLQFHLLLHHFWCKNERENGAKNKIFQNPTLKNFYEKKIQKKEKNWCNKQKRRKILRLQKTNDFGANSKMSRCSAPVKLPTSQCPQSESQERTTPPLWG